MIFELCYIEVIISNGGLLFQKNYPQRLFMGIADRRSMLFCISPNCNNLLHIIGSVRYFISLNHSLAF